MNPTLSTDDPIAQWLSPQQIVLDLDARDCAEALHSVSTMVERSRGIGGSLVFRALWRREQAASTGVGKGFAIPHARVPGIDSPVTVYARTKRPIAFGAPDGVSVSELFFILIPAENSQAEHLRLLGLVAEAFSDTGFRQRLNDAVDAPAVRSEFERWISGKGRTIIPR